MGFESRLRSFKPEFFQALISHLRKLLGFYSMTPFSFFSCCSALPQHEEGMGLIEDNEINNNTLAGVWITTGKKLPAYPGQNTVDSYTYEILSEY